MPRPSALRLLFPVLMALTLSACDQLGIETPAQTAARQEAEGKAVGGACRHAGRALEDCYKSSTKMSKAAIYAGWRDMDTYMRENKIDIVPTQETLERAEEKASQDKHATEPADAGADSTEKPADEKPVGKTPGKQS